MRDASSQRTIPRTRALLVALSLTLIPCTALGTFASEPVQKNGLRVYRERNAQGEEVLHVTNLDEFGRRIGGELEPSAEPSMTAGQCSQEQQTATAQPIVINVYNNMTQPQPYAEGSDQYAGDTSRYPGYGYARFPSAYWPSFHRNHHSINQPTGLFGRPPIIDTRPFTRETAAQRNNTAFHRH